MCSLGGSRGGSPPAGLRVCGAGRGERSLRRSPTLRPTGGGSVGTGGAIRSTSAMVLLRVMVSRFRVDMRRAASISLEPVVQARTHAQHGLAVDLTHARLADFENLADLAQVQLPVVVERQHEPLALR